MPRGGRASDNDRNRTRRLPEAIGETLHILSVVSGESIVDRHGVGKFIRLPLGRSRPLDCAAYCAAAETPRRVFPPLRQNLRPAALFAPVESHVLVPLTS